MKKDFILFLIALVILSLSLIFDSTILSFIDKIRNPLLDVFFSWLLSIEQELIFYPLVIGATLAILLLQKDKNKIVDYLASLAVAISLSFLLKAVIARPRPSTANALQDSFPSGHTTLLFISTPFFDRFIKIIWITVSSLLVLARVWTRIHYLGDVIAGAILGYFISSLIISFMDKLRDSTTKKRKVKGKKRSKKK